MLPKAKADLAQLAEMITGRLPYNPTEQQLIQLNYTAPRFSAPIIADALISASKTDSNEKLIGNLVADTLGRALKIAAGGAAQRRIWSKRMQQVVLGVVRSTANPGERTAHGNWARAMAAAQFCMAAHKYSADDPPAAASDTLWRLLALSTCASGTSRNFVRRATNWYGMLTRVAVSLTNKGAWQEAHAAMRTHGDLVKEVVSQIKYMERNNTIGAEQIVTARIEMCMSSAKEREAEVCADEEIEMAIDEEFVFASMLSDEDMTKDPLSGFANEEGVVDLPEWCVAALDVVPETQPETPPQKRGVGRPPKGLTPSPRGSKAPVVVKTIAKPACAEPALGSTLKGHFRVTVNRNGLSPAIDLVSGRVVPMGKRREANKAKRSMAFREPSVPSPVSPNIDLYCDEDPAALMRDTDNWKVARTTTFSIVNGKEIVGTHGPPHPWQLGKRCALEAMSLEQALALRA